MVEWVVPALGAAQLVLVLDNLRVFQRPARGAAATGGVSVLVPARDEAPRIAACVQGALLQPEAAEVLVLDDHSGDGTAAAARAAGAHDARLQVLAGAPLPPGWTGKNYACHQLAERARGEWLAFVDADATLAPGALEGALAYAREADLLSFWPRQELGSLGEQLLLPLLSMVLLAFLPLRLAASRPDPALSAANGQFLLFRREAYAACGGHAAVRDDLVEDVALARRVKRMGGRLVIVDAGPRVRVRMYRSLGEAWAGFRKNLYPAFGEPRPFLFALGLLVIWHVAPPFVAAGAWVSGARWLAWPFLVQWALATLLRLVLAWRLAQPRWSAFVHPVAAGLLVAIALASWRAAARGALTWKGRRYA